MHSLENIAHRVASEYSAMARLKALYPVCRTEMGKQIKVLINMALVAVFWCRGDKSARSSLQYDL